MSCAVGHEGDGLFCLERPGPQNREGRVWRRGSGLLSTNEEVSSYGNSQNNTSGFLPKAWAPETCSSPFCSISEYTPRPRFSLLPSSTVRRSSPWRPSLFSVDPANRSAATTVRSRSLSLLAFTLPDRGSKPLGPSETPISPTLFLFGACYISLLLPGRRLPIETRGWALPISWETSVPTAGLQY